MHPIILLIGGIVAYTLFGIFTARTGGKLNVMLVAIITNIVGLTLPTLVYLFSKNKSEIPATKEGIMYAVLAGICISFFSIILPLIFTKVTNVSFVMPAIYGGTVVLAGLIGIFVFRESITPIIATGLVLITVGLGLIIYANLIK